MVKVESLVRIRTDESTVALPKSRVLVEVKFVLKMNSVAATEMEMEIRIEITAQNRVIEEEDMIPGRKERFGTQMGEIERES